MSHLYTNMKDFLVSTDPALQQVDVVHGFMKRSYWAANRKRETVARSIETLITLCLVSATLKVVGNLACSCK